jgi:hypothetical protein
MNERIRQLKQQAKDFYLLQEDLDCSVKQLHELVEAKFAELIVAECARIARATPCPYEEDEVRQRLGHTWDMASLEAGREIVKHFGVEE